MRSTFFKWLGWFFLGGTLVYAVFLVDRQSDQYLSSILISIDSFGRFGAIAFVAIYVAATLICVPGSILALGGGALFGKFWGAVWVFCGGFIGAVSAFCLGRYLLKNWAKRQLTKHRYLQVVDRAIASEGWKFAFLLHLSPIIPFNILNYALGASELAFRDFTIATALGIIPGVILYTFLGSTFGDLTQMAIGMSGQSPNKFHWLVSIIGLVATLALMVYLGRVAQRILGKKLD